MRVVLDTNILARAAGSRGVPASELFERICSSHELVVSAELLAELERVLKYDRVRRMHGLSDIEIDAFLDGIASGSIIATLPTPLPRIVPHDIDDDAVIATAVVGSADVLCSRNRHLFHANVTEYCNEHAIEVLDDIALLKRLRGETIAGD